jgi:2-polyprenyl-3-methyl-5-hydroxy-6-metoxy-1,4-benzoquinol methylase
VHLDPSTEKATLDAIASDSWYAEGASAALAEYGLRVFRRYWRGHTCLELGPAEGQMTPHLVDAFEEVTLVEGSLVFAEALRERFPRADVVHSLFEEFCPSRRFDTILIGNVLEHVAAPRELLVAARTWLADDGVLLASVPNARSVHRQAAVILGLLEEEHVLNQADRHHGHRRVYDPESLRADVLAAGFRIELFGGYWLKPLSNAQIEESWTRQMLDAFMELGERYPDIAAQIFVVARRD